MKDALSKDWVKCGLGVAFSVGMTWAAFKNLPASVQALERRTSTLEVKEAADCRGIRWLVKQEAKRARIAEPELGDCEVR